jgi:hypothetical protein
MHVLTGRCVARAFSCIIDAASTSINSISPKIPAVSRQLSLHKKNRARAHHKLPRKGAVIADMRVAASPPQQPVHMQKENQACNRKTAKPALLYRCEILCSPEILLELHSEHAASLSDHTRSSFYSILASTLPFLSQVAHQYARFQY